MIEAMEQKIINNIKGPFLKNEKSRKNINYEDTSEALRLICSSRSSFYPLFENLKNNPNDKVILEQLLLKIKDVYDFTTLDCINEIILSYENSNVIDHKKRTYYTEQVPKIKEDLLNIKLNLCSITLDKLLIFHNLSCENK